VAVQRPMAGWSRSRNRERLPAALTICPCRACAGLFPREKIR